MTTRPDENSLRLVQQGPQGHRGFLADQAVGGDRRRNRRRLHQSRPRSWSFDDVVDPECVPDCGARPAVLHKRYMPWVYWIAVVMISVVGTLVTDNLVDNFGVALETTTIVFSVALAVTFALWYAGRTDPFHSHHLHDPPRDLLLARHPVHLRARDFGRRLGGGGLRPRLPRGGPDFRRRHRGDRHAPTMFPLMDGILAFWLA